MGHMGKNTIQYTAGWVNLYTKLKLKNIQFVVNSFYQKNEKTFFKFFLGTTGLWICMDLRIFAGFLYPTLLKICRYIESSFT